MRSRYKTNLKYLLRENKITSKQTSEIIGVDQNNLLSTKIGIPKMHKVAELFMVNIYDLNYGNVKKSPKILRQMPSELKEDKQTMQSVIQFFKIIKNSQKLNSLFLDSIVFESNPYNI